jgi:hypothetical protein
LARCGITPAGNITVPVLARELNSQPIALAEAPFVIKPHPERSIFGVRLTDSRRDWRQRFNREAPTAPDISIRATGA